MSLAIAKQVRCVGCDRIIKPNYKTETERIVKVIWAGKDEPQDNYHWDFDSVRNLWYRRIWTHRIVSRKFLGNYGPAGNNYFHSQTCAFEWAVRHVPSSGQSDNVRAKTRGR